jgi:hypothetical protein
MDYEESCVVEVAKSLQVLFLLLLLLSVGVSELALGYWLT